MTARGVLIRLVVAALVAGILVAAWQMPARTGIGQQAVVDVPTTVTRWKPRPEPPRPTEPYPGAWCGYLCRDGELLR